MSADTKTLAHPRTRNLPGSLKGLFAAVAGIAGFAYAINAWQVFGFARHVWRLPFVLCFAAAAVADALSLCGLFATYALRTAHWRVRTYAWVVFGAMTGLSMLAAHSFALWRQLPPDLRATAGYGDAQLASVAIVGALALAVHLLIVCVRHAEKVADGDPQPVTADAPPAVEDEAEVIAGLEAIIAEMDPTPAEVTAAWLPPLPDPDPIRSPAPSRPSRPRRLTLVPQDPTRVPRTATPPTDERKAAAVNRVIDGGESAQSVARDIGENPRNVQNWVKAERKRREDEIGSLLLSSLSSSPLHPPTTGENRPAPPHGGDDDNDDNNDGMAR